MMRTLLLDDDDTLRLVFKECIESVGHEVIECKTIEQATVALRTQKVDLLVIDLMIGASNSLGFARFAGYAAPDAEIILITGSEKFTQGELLSVCPGINWVLRKPLPPSDLEAFVEYAGHRKGEPQMLRAL